MDGVVQEGEKLWKEELEDKQAVMTEEERKEWKEKVFFRAANTYFQATNSSTPGVNNMFPISLRDYIKVTERRMLEEKASKEARESEVKRLAALRTKLVKAGLLDPAPPMRLF